MNEWDDLVYAKVGGKNSIVSLCRRTAYRSDPYDSVLVCDLDQGRPMYVT